MILARRNHLAAAGKNLPVPTVKIERDHRVYLAKVKPHKPVPTAFALMLLRKVVMPASRKVKTQALEIQTPTPHAALDAGNNNKSLI